jgi:hypothetical protein
MSYSPKATAGKPLKAKDLFQGEGRAHLDDVPSLPNNPPDYGYRWSRRFSRRVDSNRRHTKEKDDQASGSTKALPAY